MKISQATYFSSVSKLWVLRNTTSGSNALTLLGIVGIFGDTLSSSLISAKEKIDYSFKNSKTEVLLEQLFEFLLDSASWFRDLNEPERLQEGTLPSSVFSVWCLGGNIGAWLGTLLDSMFANAGLCEAVSSLFTLFFFSVKL